MLYESVNKLLNWGIKLASLAVTGPATWIVATELFHDVQSPPLLLVMRSAAVFLIEGVMLSNWILLEFDRSATSEIKARYGLTALAMYIALLVIAWQHEGPTGLVFRFALLAALLGNGWDTYVFTWQKATARADRDITATGAVRRYTRRLAEQDAKHQIDFEYDQRSKDRELQQLLSDEKRGLLQEQLRLSAKLEHRKALEQINGPAISHSESTPNRSISNTPKHLGTRIVRRGHHQMNRDRRLELGRNILAGNPELNGPEFVNQLGVELRARLGGQAQVSESTAYADYAAIRSESLALVDRHNGDSPHP